MSGPDPLPTLRAVVETIVPGPPHDPTPGALDAGVDRFLHGILARIGDEALGGVLLALDGFAAVVREGASFAELDLSERSAVLRTIGEQDLPDLQLLLRSLVSLTIAGFYGEWSGLDPAGRLATRPASWDEVGYPGPSTGYDPPSDA